MDYDLIIIGGGPGGYSAAFEAAENGLKTCLIENRELGGTCLNRGCIPTKTLVHTADLMRQLKTAGTDGIEVSPAHLDREALNAKKEAVIVQLRGGIEKLLKAGKTTVIKGTAKIRDGHTVTVNDETLTADHIILASGSEPSSIPIPGMDLPGVISSDDILNDLPLYNDLIIIGGGVIGCEIAGIYEAFGTKVTVIEALDTLLPGLDPEAGRSLALLFKKRGIDVHCKTRALAAEQNGERLVLKYEEKGEEKTAEGDAVLIAAGRRAVLDVFACEAPEISRGRIVINDRFETTIPGLLAIGDAAGTYPQLAHTAAAMGVNAVCAVLGKPYKKNLAVIPSGVYVSPEIASAGYTEKQALEAGISAVSGKANTLANPRSLISGGERGFVKVTAEKGTGRILGAVMMCERATDMIQEAAAAAAAGQTVSELLSVIHGHPTFSETFVSALEALEKKI